MKRTTHKRRMPRIQRNKRGGGLLDKFFGASNQPTGKGLSIDENENKGGFFNSLQGKFGEFTNAVDKYRNQAVITQYELKEKAKETTENAKGFLSGLIPFSGGSTRKRKVRSHRVRRPTRRL